jgi:hypothetical protein
VIIPDIAQPGSIAKHSHNPSPCSIHLKSADITTTYPRTGSACAELNQVPAFLMSLIHPKYAPQQGTYMFMSHNALNGIKPQTCLDDLESLYYVLLYFARIHMGSKYRKWTLPPPLDSWDHPSASNCKYAFLLHTFNYVTDPRLGKPFQTLVERLHSMFRDIFLQALLADRRDEPPPVVRWKENMEAVESMSLKWVTDYMGWDCSRTWEHLLKNRDELCGRYANQDSLGSCSVMWSWVY